MERIGRRAIVRPQPEELQLLNKTMSRKELAAHYNVSPSLISKWLREAGLTRNYYTLQKSVEIS